MAPRAVVPFLVAMMLLTGVTNTLLTKYQVRPSFGLVKETRLLTSSSG
jgi:hypothetical protein